MMGAEPPRRPQPGPVPSSPAQGEPPGGRATIPLAEILGRVPQRDTPASEPRAPWRELPPLLTPRRDPRILQPQSPLPVAPTQSPAPEPENRAERGSESAKSSSSD
jgi:hypothetical protein